MANPAVLLDLTFRDLEGQNPNQSNFSPLYVKNGQTYTHVFIEKVLGSHMWSA